MEIEFFSCEILSLSLFICNFILLISLYFLKILNRCFFILVFFKNLGCFFGLCFSIVILFLIEGN